jgi:hypothetical protein
LIETDIDNLLKEFEITPYSLQLQILQAHLKPSGCKIPNSGKPSSKGAHLAAQSLPAGRCED